MKHLDKLYYFIIFISILMISNLSSANCSITGVDSLSFGSYNPLDTNDSISQNNITINCRGKKSFTIKLSTGNSGDFSQRKLNYTLGLGLISLNYNIYLDSGYTSIWGDGTNNTSFYSNSIKGTDVITAYGKLPAKQNVIMGTYTDSIMVTLEF